MSVVWSALLAFLITTVGQGVWGALVVTNLATSPAVPWAAVVMGLVLWLMWQYLGGWGWPRGTAEARRRLRRANPVTGLELRWAVVAGALSIVALAGYWIVMFHLVKMPGTVLPEFSSYPLRTVALLFVMGSLVAPLVEETAFRGYGQLLLERDFRAPIAVGISSVLFALAHVTHGFLGPKLFVYFLAGLVFGATAHLTNSILPGMAVHVAADLTFFTLVWPHDTTRRLVGEGGADAWFWIHVSQALAFTALAILAFRRLARISGRTGGASGVDGSIITVESR